MGAFLDKPKTEKTNDVGVGAGLEYGVASMQGWRVDMEDAHVAKIGFEIPGFFEWSFFAVFDGHAGYKVAAHASKHLFEFVCKTTEFQNVVTSLANGRTCDAPEVIEDIKIALRTGFLTLDDHMRRLPDLCGETERSGSTATCVLISPTHLFFANLGDSRAVHSRDGNMNFATEDHKPFHPKERERIVNAGGSVLIQRVNGTLAVSRALGDYEYKSIEGYEATAQLVSPDPDVTVFQRDETDEFIFLACDGVYDVMSNNEVCDFVRSRLIVMDTLSDIGNQVLDACLSKGSRDNISAILIKFPGAPQITEMTLSEEQALVKDLEERVRNVSTLCDNMKELDYEFVFRLLIHQEIPGLPPGAGIHGLRSTIEQIIEKLKNGPPPANSSSAGSPAKSASPVPPPRETASAPAVGRTPTGKSIPANTSCENNKNTPNNNNNNKMSPPNGEHAGASPEQQKGSVSKLSDGKPASAPPAIVDARLEVGNNGSKTEATGGTNNTLPSPGRFGGGGSKYWKQGGPFSLRRNKTTSKEEKVIVQRSAGIVATRVVEAKADANMIAGSEVACMEVVLDNQACSEIVLDNNAASLSTESCPCGQGVDKVSATNCSACTPPRSKVACPESNCTSEAAPEETAETKLDAM